MHHEENDAYLRLSAKKIYLRKVMFNICKLNESRWTIYASLNCVINGSVNGCRLLGAKLLHAPMLIYCQLDPSEQTSVKSQLQFKHFHCRKYIWKCPLEIVDFSCDHHYTFTYKSYVAQQAQQTLLVFTLMQDNKLPLLQNQYDCMRHATRRQGIDLVCI